MVGCQSLGRGNCVRTTSPVAVRIVNTIYLRAIPVFFLISDRVVVCQTKKLPQVDWQRKYRPWSGAVTQRMMPPPPFPINEGT